MNQENIAAEENQTKPEEIYTNVYTNYTPVAEGSAKAASTQEDDTPFNPNIVNKDGCCINKPLNQCVIGLCLCLICNAMFIFSLVHPEWAVRSYAGTKRHHLKNLTHRETFGLYTSCVNLSADKTKDQCVTSGVTDSALWTGFKVMATLCTVLSVCATMMMVKLIYRTVCYRKYSKTEDLKSTFLSIGVYNIWIFSLIVVSVPLDLVWLFGGVEGEIKDFDSVEYTKMFKNKIASPEISIWGLGSMIGLVPSWVMIGPACAIDGLKNSLKKELINRLGTEKYKQFEKDGK